MNVLIACESSGRVREAFRKRGHDAWSCDLNPAEDGSKFHFEGDALEFIQFGPKFDLIIAHPPCTYLCNSGVRWLWQGGNSKNPVNADRWKEMHAGAKFFKQLYNYAVARNPEVKMARENPVPHPYARQQLGPPDQYVQPWWFGDPAFKATGLWLHRLKPLVPTNKLIPPKPGTPEHKAWSAIHRASPGPNRSVERSRTFQGIANAMAEQWG
jgi:hypothetical protein